MGSIEEKSKQQVYEDSLLPLVSDLVARCGEHRVPLLLLVGVGNDEANDHMVGNILLSDETGPPRVLVEMYKRAFGVRMPMAARDVQLAAPIVAVKKPRKNKEG